MRVICVCFFDMVLKQYISNKPQTDKDRAGIPGFRQIGESGSSDVLASMQLTYEGGGMIG